MIKKLIKENRYTIVTLARELQVSRTTIYRWINEPDTIKDIKVTTFMKLCSLLQCKYEDLIPDLKSLGVDSNCIL